MLRACALQKRSRRDEKPTVKSSPCLLQLEKACVRQQRPSTTPKKIKAAMRETPFDDFSLPVQSCNGCYQVLAAKSVNPYKWPNSKTHFSPWA